MVAHPVAKIDGHEHSSQKVLALGLEWRDAPYRALDDALECLETKLDALVVVLVLEQDHFNVLVQLGRGVPSR